MGKQTSKKNKGSARKKLTAVVVGTILLTAGAVGVAKRVVPPGEEVISVIDGDSFKIGNDQTIRLLSIDAPEMGNCFSQEAKEALSKKFLVKGLFLKS